MDPKAPRVSAAAVRRAREALVAQRTAPPDPLPPEVVSWLGNGYKPEPELRQLWPCPLLPFVRQSLTVSGVHGTESLRKHVTHLVHLGAWVHLRGGVLNPTDVLTRPVIDEYCRVGMPGSSDNSRSDRRSRLRKIADRVHPEQAPVPAVSIGRAAIKPPYTDSQMSSIRRVAGVQPTEELIRQMSICVGSGRGAGIDSPDLRLLTADHVVDHGQDGIAIHVPGERSRTVWVLRQYEPLVRRGVAGLRDGDLLIGRVQDRRNVAADVYGRATLVGDLPHLEQSRLRTTWLTHLMCRPVPLNVILHAAGLKSTRTLFDLLPHLPVTTDPGPLLRDGGVA